MYLSLLPRTQAVKEWKKKYYFLLVEWDFASTPKQNNENNEGLSEILQVRKH